MIDKDRVDKRAAAPQAIWIGGTGSWSHQHNWSPPGGGAITSFWIDGGNAIASQVLLDINQTIADLTVDLNDTLTVQNGRRLIVDADDGWIDNNGLIRVQGQNALTDLLVGCGGPVTLEGNGSLVLEQSFNSRIVGLCDTAHLINELMISGAGEIGAGTLRVTNYATINANRQLELITLTPSEGGFTNAGTLLASGGGNLRLIDGTFINDGGTIRADNFSHIDLINATVRGGALQTIGNGVLRTHFGGASLDSVTLDGTLEVGLVKLSLHGNITNNGVIEIVANNSIDGLPEFTEIVLPDAANNVTLGGFGELHMNWANIYSGSTAIGSRFIHGSEHTISGAGIIGDNTVALTNHGTIIGDSDLPLVIDPPNAQQVVNSGTLRAAGTGGLVLTGGSFRNSGTIEVLPGSRCYVTGTATLADVSGSTLTGGTWRVIAGDQVAAVITPYANGLFNGGDVTLSGPGSNFSFIHSIFNNYGRLAIEDRRQFTAMNSFFSNDGEMFIGTGSRLTVNGQYSHGSIAETHVELTQAHIGGTHVSILVNGNATLAGTLRISVGGDPQPLVGQLLPVLFASSISGGFQSIITPPNVHVVVIGSQIFATIVPCETDMNGDGVTDTVDLLQLVGQWGICPMGASCSGDMNDDGLVNSTDLMIMIAQWGPCD